MNPRYTGPVADGPSDRAICTLEIARAEPSTTVAASPVASARTHPTTRTRPAGGAGVRTLSPPTFSVDIHPRSTITDVPASVRSGVTTSTPEAPLRVWYRITTDRSARYVPVATTRRHSSCGRDARP